MWFGTHSGVNRFDGRSFKVLSYLATDTISLDDDFVTNIFEDHRGNIWVTTRSGVNIYNPLSELFTHDVSALLEPMGITETDVTAIHRDVRGNYWYVVGPKLYKHSPQTNTTVGIDFIPEELRGRSDQQVTSISESPQGALWVVTSRGLLVRIDALNNRIIEYNTQLANRFDWKAFDYKVFVDNDDDLWVNTLNDARGVFHLRTKDNTLIHFHKESARFRLNNNITMGVVQDNQGYVWVGTDHGGLNIISKADYSVSYVLNDPYFDKSLSQNVITALYRDNTGIIWVGTYKKGVNYFHEDIIKFRTIRSIASSPASLGVNDVNCFVEDSRGNIWVGTNGGGLKYFDRQRGTFRHYVNDASDPYSISSNVIVSLHIDSRGTLWIGTYHGGLNYFDGKRFHLFTANPYISGTLNSNNIWSIAEDKQGNLWLATIGGGLNVMDRSRNTFYSYQHGQMNSVSSNFILDVAFDRYQNLWVATADGLNMLDKQTGRFVSFTAQRNVVGTLSNNNVNCLYEDSRGLIWVGTRYGLNLFNRANGSFRVFMREDGLPNNTIHSIAEDANGDLWIGTLGGLSHMSLTASGDSLQDISFKNYDEMDGLQGREFNLGSALSTSKGELLFGGANGFNLFSPDMIRMNTRIPNVIFTDFQIYNRSIGVNEVVNGRVLLGQSISHTQKIVLKHRENMFSIGFAALNHFHPEKNRYLYKLEGFNTQWLEPDPSILKATYTNLNPGEYTFRVIASNNDGVWNYQGASIRIVVLPPFWKSPLAFSIYFVLIALALIALRLLIIKRTQGKIAIEQARKEAQQRHEFDMLKIKLFTNISHEFKTPLTLILNPIEKILKETDSEKYRSQLQLVHRNARRLLNLVSQLLDFRRMEVQEVKLNPVLGDMAIFSEEICQSFSDLAEKKTIKLHFSSNLPEALVFFDHEKYERILFNLLSNAFKFTPQNGSIEVSLEFPDPSLPNDVSARMNEERFIRLRVKDNGIGVPKEKHELIFERFFQNITPGKSLNPGSGIGLSMVTEYVKLHKGQMQLESEPGKGSCFTILLPYYTHLPPADDSPSIPSLATPTNYEEGVDDKSNTIRKPLLLIVEDNADFRFYLKDNLKGNYAIEEACNGKEGLKASLSLMPDLIVSDVMMPEMDGIEMAKKIRSDKRTSHIPIILLTARASGDHKMESFEIGVDDYLAKPFSFEILESRIRNLIVQRELLRSAFQKHFEVNPSEISITSLDEKLIGKAIAIVEKNISNPNFSVEELSREVGMSRVHLYKKLLALTGKSPIEFIRILRLKRAAQLLRQSQLTVSEIAYEVGFNNPKYFSKYFKAEFNVLPSQFASQADTDAKAQPGGSADG